MLCDNWTVTDTALETTFQVVSIVDMAQTLRLEQKGLQERGLAWIVLGKQPNRKQIIAYFALSSITHFGVSCDLHRFRKLWLVGTIGQEAKVVIDNNRLGVSITW